MPATPPHDVQYLDLVDYLYLAGAALDVAPEDLFHRTDLGLAESALHAPAATFAGVDLYPDLVTKARVLLVHLVKNHPLLDGTSAPGSWPCWSSWLATGADSSPPT